MPTTAFDYYMLIGRLSTQEGLYVQAYQQNFMLILFLLVVSIDLEDVIAETRMKKKEEESHNVSGSDGNNQEDLYTDVWVAKVPKYFITSDQRSQNNSKITGGSMVWTTSCSFYRTS